MRHWLNAGSLGTQRRLVACGALVLAIGLCALQVAGDHPSAAQPRSCCGGSVVRQDASGRVLLAATQLGEGLLTRPGLPIAGPRAGAEVIPEGCQPARERALQLLQELEPRVSAQARAEAEKYVESRDPAATIGKAWDDFAVGALMYGDKELAAWAGLNAITHEWQAPYVANCGVYLTHLGRLTEALMLLNCAYEMGDRSPYLFEALAVAYQRLGDAAKAKQHILQAKQSAPDDPAINVEASLMTTGRPPAPPAPSPPGSTDALDQRLKELQAQADRFLDLTKGAVELLDRLEHFRGSRDHIVPALQASNRKLLAAMSEQVAQAKMTREEYTRRFQPAGTPFSEASYKMTVDAMYNSALSSLAASYFVLTHGVLSFAGTMSGHDLLFWAEVVRLDSGSFAREQREVAGGPLHEIADLRSIGNGHSVHFQDDLDGFREARRQKLAQCAEIRDSAAHDACIKQAEREYCAAAMARYDQYANDVRARYLVAANNFGHVARGVLVWAENEVLDARGYAVRCVNSMRFDKNAPRMPVPGGGTATMAEFAVQGINLSYRTGLLEPNLDAQRGKVVRFVREQAEWFERDRANTERSLAGHKQYIEDFCREVLRQASLEQLTQEEWEAYMNELRERMMQDLTTEVKFNPNCEASIGPFTLGVDLLTGKGTLSGKFKHGPATFGAKASLQDGEIVGTTISAGTGYGVSGSAYGAAWKGSVTVAASHDTATGQWDTLVKASGTLGVGLQKEGFAGVACYPGSASVTLNARTFVEHAWDYMVADAQRP